MTSDTLKKLLVAGAAVAALSLKHQHENPAPVTEEKFPPTTPKRQRGPKPP